MRRPLCLSQPYRLLLKRVRNARKRRIELGAQGLHQPACCCFASAGAEIAKANWHRHDAIQPQFRASTCRLVRCKTNNRLAIAPTKRSKQEILRRLGC